MVLRLFAVSLGIAVLFGCGKAPEKEPKSRMLSKDDYLKNRSVLLGTAIDDDEATRVIAYLLFLEKQSKDEPITLYINSPGGSATAGLAILRTMETLKPKIQTCCIGQAHSMAAIILAAGTHGFRSSNTNAVIAFSRLRAAQNMTPEKQIYFDRLEAELITTTSRLTGMTKEQTTKLFDSSEALTSNRARDLGIIDRIVSVQ